METVMKTKICTSCKLKLNETEFYAKQNRLQAKCKKCFNLYCMDRWTKRKKFAIEYKGGICADCKKEYPHPVYDFHHLDPSEKDLQWTKMRLVSKERMIAELDKCVLLCSNCHRMRHYGQGLRLVDSNHRHGG